MTTVKLHIEASFVEQDFLYYKNNITENMKITVQNHLRFKLHVLFYHFLCSVINIK